MPDSGFYGIAETGRQIPAAFMLQAAGSAGLLKSPCFFVLPF
jgi:hypothetical protein